MIHAFVREGSGDRDSRRDDVRQGPYLELAKLGFDAVRVLSHLPVAELLRRATGPRRALGLARSLGRLRRARSAHGRHVLRTLITVLDAKVPGTNCYRRVLVESALDPGAAAEQVHFGLDRGAAPGSGHAWLDSDRAQARPFEAVFSL